MARRRNQRGMANQTAPKTSVAPAPMRIAANPPDTQSEIGEPFVNIRTLLCLLLAKFVESNQCLAKRKGRWYQDKVERRFSVVDFEVWSARQRLDVF